MKTIIKNSRTLVKVLLVGLFIAGVSVDSFAQKEKKEKKEKEQKTEKALVRPAKVGHAATDEYVTSAFDLYEKNQKISKKLSDVAGNADDMIAVKKDLEAQMEEVKGLLGKSTDVINGAKTITPKTDSIKAVKAANAGTKALNATQKAIPGQLEMIKNQSGK